MNKKILIGVSIIIVIILTALFSNGSLAPKKEQLYQIFYLSNKNEAVEQVRFNNRDKGEKIAKIDNGENIPSDFLKKADVLWVDFEYLAQDKDKNLALSINKTIDLNIPVIFMGEQLERNKIADCLDIKHAEGTDLKNTGEAILKGIKVNRTSKGYFFTDIYIGKEESKDEEQIYSGLADASYSEI